MLTMFESLESMVVQSQSDSWAVHMLMEQAFNASNDDMQFSILSRRAVPSKLNKVHSEKALCNAMSFESPNLPNNISPQLLC